MVATLCVMVYWSLASRPALLLWFGALTLLIGLRMLRWRRYRGAGLLERGPDRWLRETVRSNGATGALFGAGALIMLLPVLPAYQLTYGFALFAMPVAAMFNQNFTLPGCQTGQQILPVRALTGWGDPLGVGQFAVQYPAQHADQRSGGRRLGNESPGTCAECRRHVAPLVRRRHHHQRRRRAGTPQRVDRFYAAQARQGQVEQDQAKRGRRFGMRKTLRSRPCHQQFKAGKGVTQHLQERIAVQWMVVDDKNGARQTGSPVIRPAGPMRPRPAGERTQTI